MMRAAALCALSLALVSCGTPSGSLPPPVAVEQPKPKTVDPRVCAEVAKPPALPEGAGVPQAVTPEERNALALFLTWVAELVDHDKGVSTQADLARREACP